MWILAISLLCLTVVALASGVMRNRNLKRKLREGKIDRMPDVVEADGECCGQHEVCEKDSLLAAVSKQIEYYDDEELDDYIGIPSGNYGADQVEQFRDVFYTMRDTEVAGWVRSLQLRGVNLPDDIKDEVFLVIGERRMN